MRIAMLVLLVAANLLTYSWWQGHLSPLWPPPGAAEREPERLARQLQPEGVNIVGQRAGSPGAAPASSTSLGNVGSPGR